MYVGTCKQYPIFNIPIEDTTIYATDMDTLHMSVGILQMRQEKKVTITFVIGMVMRLRN